MLLAIIPSIFTVIASTLSVSMFLSKLPSPWTVTTRSLKVDQCDAEKMHDHFVIRIEICHLSKFLNFHLTLEGR